MVPLLLSVSLALSAGSPLASAGDAPAVSRGGGSAGDAEEAKPSLGRRVVEDLVGWRGALVAVPAGFALGSVMDIVIITPIAMVLVLVLVPQFSGADSNQEMAGATAIIGAGVLLFSLVVAFWGVVTMAAAGLVGVTMIPTLVAGATE